jgi:serine/threonine-protein kinase
VLPTDSRYELLVKIASGGMATVYVGRRVGAAGFQRLVAIKRAHSHLVEDPVFKRMVIAEAKLASRIHHPNVVAVHDVEELDGELLLVMDYIEGASLAELAPEGDHARKLPLDVTLAVLLDACAGLRAAHELSGDDGEPLNLVHRDVSPQNILVGLDGLARIADFGIAKSSSHTVRTAAGALKGKIRYMAPEYVDQGKMDARGDVFALGVVLWEALTSTRLFGGESEVETLKLVLACKVPAPSTLAPDVDAVLDALVLRALARDPDARFESARAFADALESFASTHGGVASRRRVGEHVAGATEPTLTRRREVLRTRTEAVKESDPPDPFEDTAVAHQRTATLAPTAPGADGQTLGGQVSAGPSATVDRQAPRVEEPVATGPLPPPAPRTGSWRPFVGAALAVAAVLALGAVLVRRSGGPAPAPAPVAAQRECATNAACVDRLGGRAAVCRARDGKCALVESEDCKALAEPEDLRDEGTLWLGAMFPQTGPRARNGKTDVQAADLARRDFAQALGTYRSTMFGLRRVALAMCDDASNADRAARHLVDDVGVPAIFGFGSGSTLIDLSGALLVPRGVLAIATMPTAPQVTRVPQPPGRPRLVWRTTYSLALMAQAIGRIVPDVLEKFPRAREDLRVALLRDRSPAADAFADDLFKGLVFNGKSALENSRAYREIAVPSTGAASTPASDAAAELAQFAPHVVVYFAGTPEGNANVVGAIGELEKRGTKARYLGATPFPSQLFDLVGDRADARKRFLALTLVSTTPVNARFVLHYNTTFDDKITRAQAPNTSYDAFYLLAYAAYARGANEPVTGESLAASFARLIPPGTPIDATPASILDGATRIRRGESIDLQGATGKLDFDVETGEALSDVAALCMEVQDGRASGSVESGLVYDVTTRRVSGALRCPQ